jgi:uncharacterized integral membrane protein
MTDPYQPPPGAEPPPPPERPTVGAEPRAHKRAVSTGQILGGILLVVVVVFVLENTRSVQVRLIGPEVNTPVAVPVVIGAVLGALVAWLLRYRRHRHHPPR